MPHIIFSQQKDTGIQKINNVELYVENGPNYFYHFDWSSVKQTELLTHPMTVRF